MCTHIKKIDVYTEICVKPYAVSHELTREWYVSIDLPLQDTLRSWCVQHPDSQGKDLVKYIRR